MTGIPGIALSYPSQVPRVFTRLDFLYGAAPPRPQRLVEWEERNNDTRVLADPLPAAGVAQRRRHPVGGAAGGEIAVS